MKKSSTKSTKSPAPATKSTAAKSVAKTKTTAAATVRSETPTPVAMLAPQVATKNAVKAVAAKPVVTTIAARVNVGFGNTLFVRGEGAGLSWEKGVAMQCISDDLWQIVLSESARAYTFKFLINDTTWSQGPDYTAACGTSVTLSPEF